MESPGYGELLQLQCPELQKEKQIGRRSSLVAGLVLRQTEHLGTMSPMFLAYQPMYWVEDMGDYEGVQGADGNFAGL